MISKNVYLLDFIRLASGLAPHWIFQVTTNLLNTGYLQMKFTSNKLQWYK